MIKKIKTIKALISYILVFSFVIAFTQPVFATNDNVAVYQLEFVKDGTICSFKILQDKNEWYVESNGLAQASGSRLSINDENNQVALFRGENITILYTANKSTYVVNNGEYYLPLQEATVSVGLRFYENNNYLCAECIKVPKELLTDLSAMFRNNNYSTTRMILDLGNTYAVMESLSRIYAALPFVGNSNIIAEVTGAGERDRYEEAFATILANEGALSELISESKTFQSEIKKSNKILDLSQKILDSNSALAQYLGKEGIDKELLDLFTTEFSKYDNEGSIIEWFSAAVSVSDALNLGEFLNLMTFYSSVIDAEESVARAMVSVFQDSDNRFAYDAVNNVFSMRYGSGTSAMGSIYGEWIGDKVIDSIYDKGKDLLLNLEGIAKLKTLAVTKAIDYCTGASDKSNAILYTTIYSSIQQELAAYFYNHLYDSEKETAVILRGVGIMYLKAALAAYENYSFDEDLSNAINNATTMIAKEIEALLAYSEAEYCPKYDNSCAVQAANRILKDASEDSWSPAALLGLPLSEAISLFGNEYTITGLAGSKLVSFKNGAAFLLEGTPTIWADTHLDDNIIVNFITTSNEYNVNGFSTGMTLNEIEDIVEAKSASIEVYTSMETESYVAYVEDKELCYSFEWYYGEDPRKTPNYYMSVGSIKSEEDMEINKAYIG